jgi:hypothetical protein
MPSTRRIYYSTAKMALENGLSDLAMLAGDIASPGDAAWQDVAGTAVLNLRTLANYLEQARLGRMPGPITFPSPAEAMLEHLGG